MMDSDLLRRSDRQPADMKILTIRVKPHSKHQDIQTAADGSLVVRLKSQPIDGKANAELIKLLSNQYGLPASRIAIKTGGSSRLKRVEIDD